MSRLFAIELPLPQGHCTLHLLEPPGSCQQSLWARLCDRSYNKPFIVDNRLRRYLHFDLDAIQSAMHLEHPERLSLIYTRKMMAFLLFNRAPANILLLGLGGGSLAKFCYQRLPDAELTVVEVNPDVIALRDAFRVPADDDRFRVICADGAAYVTRLAQCMDVILADACDRQGTAPELGAIEFYQAAHRCLSREGMFVTNLCGDASCCAAHVAKIHSVFGDAVLTLPVRSGANVIVLAFKEHRPDIDWGGLSITANKLKLQFGLAFPRYVRRIGRPGAKRSAAPSSGCSSSNDPTLLSLKPTAPMSSLV